MWEVAATLQRWLLVVNNQPVHLPFPASCPSCIGATVVPLTMTLFLVAKALSTRMQNIMSTAILH